MAKTKVRPSSMELQILKLLWVAKDQGRTPLAVREVRQLLCDAGRDLAHTTVITTMENMVRKKLLRRSKRKNANFYSPAVRQADIQQSELSEMLTEVFDGSPQQLMSALLNSNDINQDALQEIRQLISDAEGKQ